MRAKAALNEEAATRLLTRRKAMMTRPESEIKVASMFDKVAPRYDLLNSLLSLRQDQRWRRKLLSWTQAPTEGLCHLDVATGTGDVLLQFAKRYPSAKKLTGVDISAGMLALAAQKAHKLGLDSHVSFRTMSAEQLALPAESFHSVSIAFGLRNVVAKDKALAEFYRVLKPGGWLYILEFFTPQNSLLAHGFQFYFHAILPRIGALLSDKEAYQYLPKSVETFYSLTQLEQVLTSTGFKHFRKHAFLWGSCRLIAAQKI